MTIAIVAVALALCASLLWIGRRDLTHPAVAFGVVWFVWVAISQLRVTDAEGAWSLGFASIVFGGAFLFIAAAVISGGTAAVRGTIRPARPDARILLAAALVLGVCGAAGLAWEAQILGGVPLFSGNTDVLRGRAYTAGHRVPSVVGYLVDGLHVTFWLLLTTIALTWRRWSWRRQLPLAILALAAFVAAAAGGSRNALLFTVLVPVFAAYALRQEPFTIRQRTAIVAAGVLIVAFLGAFSVYRTDQKTSGLHGFVERSAPHSSAAYRAAFLVYIGGALGFESERRLVAEMPSWFSYDSGVSSLEVLPDRLFPNGKPSFSSVVAAGIRNREPDVDWTVATYQARPFYDFGVGGVLLVSIITGLILGAAYRLARGKEWFLAAVVVGIVAYYSAFLFYVNQLSLDRTWAYDLVALAVVEYLARRYSGARRSAYGTRTEATSG